MRRKTVPAYGWVYDDGCVGGDDHWKMMGSWWMDGCMGGWMDDDVVDDDDDD